MTYYRPHLLPKVRSEKIMASAEGKPCTLRISSFYPGHGCTGPDTTVLCHIDSAGGKGVSTKVTDIGGVYACPHCDAIMTGIDVPRRQYIVEKYGLALGHRIYSALVETHTMMVEDAVIVVPDGEIIG